MEAERSTSNLHRCISQFTLSFPAEEHTQEDNQQIRTSCFRTALRVAPCVVLSAWQTWKKSTMFLRRREVCRLLWAPMARRKFSIHFDQKCSPSKSQQLVGQETQTHEDVQRWTRLDMLVRIEFSIHENLGSKFFSCRPWILAKWQLYRWTSCSQSNLLIPYRSHNKTLSAKSGPSKSLQSREFHQVCHIKHPKTQRLWHFKRSSHTSLWPNFLSPDA